MQGSEERPSVGIVAHDAGGIGGMERQIERVALGLAERGYPVTVYAATCTFAGQGGVRWIRVPSPHPMSVRLPAFAALALLQILRHGRPDVLLTTGAIVPMRTDYAVVHFCHHAYRARHGRRAPARSHPLWALNARLAEVESLWAERALYRRGMAHGLVAVSKHTAEELRAHVPGRLPPLHVAENGVDTAAFAPQPALREQRRRDLGIPAEQSVLLFVGGDWALKRLALAIEALRHAPGWMLLVVGPGDVATHERLAARCGVADRVRFVGRTADPRPHYGVADLFVHPSRSEASSLVLLEACASGVGVVTTLDNAIVRDLVGQGAALQVAASPEAIGRTIDGITAPGRMAMGTAARRAALDRDWRHTVDRFEELVLGARRARLAPSPDASAPSETGDTASLR